MVEYLFVVPLDMWLRLAARSPSHDNASQRLQMESNMTSARLAGQQIAAACRPNSLNEVLAMTIPLPALAGPKTCRPGVYQRNLLRCLSAG